MGSIDHFQRLFIAIERACWRGRTLNRANVARAYDRLECLAVRDGSADVRQVARMLRDQNRDMVRTGCEHLSDGNCAPRR